MLRNVNNVTQSMSKVASRPPSESESFRRIVYYTSLPTALSHEDRSWYHGPLIGNQHSVAGTATRYGLDGTRIHSWWGGGDVPHPSERPWGPSSPLYNGYWVCFPEVKRPGRGVHHPSHPAPRLKKEQRYNSNPPLGLRGLFYGELYLFL